MGLLRLLMFCFLVYMAMRFWRSLLGSIYQAQQRQQQPQRGRQSVPPPGAPPRQAATPSPWEILGVSPDATQREIRQAYQKLVQQYHPDKVGDMGPELRELAERRTKEITAAYNQLKRSGGD
jgi:DnaJ-class molecular chaperone